MEMVHVKLKTTMERKEDKEGRMKKKGIMVKEKKNKERK